MRILKEFVYSLDFVHMQPDNSIIKRGVPRTVSVRALVGPGQTYAVYLRRAAVTHDPPNVQSDALVLDIPAGSYSAQWIDPLTGHVKLRTDQEHTGGEMTLSVPDYVDDVALKVVRQ
jgi:hypothetical protein